MVVGGFLQCAGVLCDYTVSPALALTSLCPGTGGPWRAPAQHSFPGNQEGPLEGSYGIAILGVSVSPFYKAREGREPCLFLSLPGLLVD